ncbi:MAG TPA: urea ABC transporter permease subunit UrtB [Roseiarcus sp.]|nr:urea ABC transporter permease subunit UrtB [Roseiarcus sp.]
MVLFALLCLGLSSLAVADGRDDAFNKLFADKYSQTEQAIAGLAIAAPPHGAEILKALGDGRLFLDPAGKRVVYKTSAGAAFDARTGARIDGVEGLKKVRVNNGVRRALEAAIGALSLGAADPQQRIRAAQDLFNNPNPKALAVVDAQLAEERDAAARAALEQARAAIVASTANASAVDARRAIAALAARGGEAAKNYINAVSAKHQDPAIVSAAQSAVADIDRSLLIWGMAQNGWYGISAASVLLLAAIGLAITFGVMGVINMAHGEMVMLGAYSTYVVQMIVPAAMANWSVVLALPIAFLVSAAAGVAIERCVIRYLYTRPLETLLATWGVSLILQQAVRTLFGASNRQVYSPPFLSGAFHLGGLEITQNRLWIIVLSVMVFAMLLFVLRATSFGLQMRAVTQNRRMASAMGISTTRVDMLAFGLGSGVAGVAGVALSQIDNVSPNLGQGYIIDSFMVVVFGGVGNLWGAAFGALTLGLANKILEPIIGAVQGQIVLLAFIILFIQKRPRGLFAQKGRAVES